MTFFTVKREFQALCSEMSVEIKNKFHSLFMMITKKLSLPNGTWQTGKVQFTHERLKKDACNLQ